MTWREKSLLLIELTLGKRAKTGRCLPQSAPAMGAFRDSPDSPEIVKAGRQTAEPLAVKGKEGSRKQCLRPMESKESILEIS